MSTPPDSTLADPEQIIAELRRANADLQQRLDDAQAREAATAEVLGVINSSPGDLQRQGTGSHGATGVTGACVPRR
jgi:hypothetical protein